MSEDDFTKLYRGITKSTVWVGQPRHVKLAWVTMLAEADEVGRVTTPVPGLAKLAEITVEEFEEALDIFMAPDKYSRSTELDGRRVVPLDDEEYSGFRLVTHAKHRAKRDPAKRREQNRAAQERWRERNRVSQKSQTDSVADETTEVSHNGDRDIPVEVPDSSDVVSQPVSQNKPIPSASASASNHSLPDPDPPDRLDLPRLVESYLADECSKRLEHGPAEYWPEVRRVLDTWRECWGREVRIRGGLRDSRLRAILERLQDGYSSCELCDAVRGARRDEFTVTSHSAGRVESVLRDPSRVDKFRELLVAELPEPARAGERRGVTPEDL
jgi:hypothetical protein